jgi:hypothetical protein
VSQIASGTQTTAAVSGPVVVMVSTGFERSKTFTYAHNGRASVSAQPMPKVN